MSPRPANTYQASGSDRLPSSSIFSSLQEASSFFEAGSLGYSATSRVGEYDGLELRTFTWQMEPLDVSRVESSFFDNRQLFPPGSAEFDCALLMRKIAHEWHGRDSLTVGVASVTTSKAEPHHALDAQKMRASDG